MPGSEKRSIALVQKAIADIKKGKMVVLTDDGDRENEGDLVMAAEKVTPAAINFMAREGRGLVCLSLTEERVRQLHLPLMVVDNTSPLQTAFTVSIEAAHGVTTGISAADRARTIRAAIASKAKPSDLSRPGHIFPLRARDGGVLVRPGHTEGSVDLARMAGLMPAGVICEVMNDDGTMARRPDLERFARRHKLTLLSIADIITWRMAHETLVHRVAETAIERAPFGGFKAIAYGTDVDDAVHVALVKGDVATTAPVLTRIHRATFLGDLLESCTGEGALRDAFQRIAEAKAGVLLVLHKHLRGPDALSLALASNIQPVAGGHGQGRLKEFGIGAQILKDLGVKRLKLMTHATGPILGVERYGLEVVDQIHLDEPATTQPRRPAGGGHRRRSSVG